MLSCNMGELIPCFLQECVPGDKWKLSCESLVRFAPMVAPVMGQVDTYVHYFFVPKRLLWKNYENWITGTKVSGSVPVSPYFQISGVNTGIGTLGNYLGLPTWDVGVVNKVSAMPFAAYQFIYNEYYRDQNLVNSGQEIPYELADGDIGLLGNFTTVYNVLRLRAWAHDRFTSALPFAQKGDVVTMPIGGFNDVPVRVTTASGGATTLTGAPHNVGVAGDTPTPNVTEDIYAETSQLNSVTTTITDFRRALALQKFLEQKARGGTRLTEFNYAVYGVKGSDARLQRPEYITGAKSAIQVSEVLNTTGTTGQLPQGNMSGHGVGVVSGQYGSYFCEESGYIMGIMSIIPKTAYQEGIPKHWLKYDDASQEFIPQFENIGEQPIENREVYANNGVNPLAAFGYTPRYSEYKYANNQVSGEFMTSLSQWHWGRIFGAIPALNETFIACAPSHRNFAVTDPAIHKMYVHHFNRAGVVRGMSRYGTPSI